MLLSPLLYIKYYQTDLQLASDHLGKYCVLLSVVGYGAPLISLVSTILFVPCLEKTCLWGF